MIRLLIYIFISMCFLNSLLNTQHYNVLKRLTPYKLQDSVCKNNKWEQRAKHEYSKNHNAYYRTTYYKDSLTILHREHQLPMYKGKKSFDLLIKNHFPLGIKFTYNQDSLVEMMMVYKPVAYKFEVAKAYYSNFYNSPTSIKELNLNIEEQGHLRVEFRDKFFFKWILYFHKDKDEEVGVYKSITFHENNEPATYGTYRPGKGRIGKWYTYYKNGTISSEGNYDGSEFDDYLNEFNLKKDGTWSYYAENGCIQKEEVWDKGKLVKTINY